MATHSVTIYSAPWCGFCAAAKRYLDEKGIKYTDRVRFLCGSFMLFGSDFGRRNVPGVVKAFPPFIEE